MVRKLKKNKKIAPKNGARFHTKQYDDGSQFLKIKIPIDELTPDDLRKVARLIEELEDGHKLPWYKYWGKQAMKFFVRYSMSNIVQVIFLLTVLRYFGISK